MRVSLRQVVVMVTGIALAAIPCRNARASMSSRAVVEGGTIAIPLNGEAARALKPARGSDCPSARTRVTPERRVGRVLLKAQTAPIAQKA